MPTVQRLAALSLVAGLLASDAALAADHPIAVAKLAISRSASGREKLVLVVKDRTMPFATPGSADDPVVGTPGGLRLDLANADLDRASLAAPKGAGWRATTTRYDFTNRDAPLGPSPIQRITWRDGRVLKLTARAAGLPTDRPMGRVVVRLVAGGTRACGILDGSSVRRDAPGQFVAANAPAPAIADCSDASLGIASGTTTTTVAGSTTTSTVGGGTTTTTTLPANATVLDFTNAASAASCGRSADAGDVTLRAFSCGGLELGGGQASVGESVTPAGSTSRFQLTGCAGDVCSVAGWGGSGPDFDCTTAGCPFGAPLPIANGGTSSCVVNSLADAPSGHLDVSTGASDDLAIPLAAHVYVTGNATQPCPRCSASGAAGAPASGTCDRGARAGLSCTTVNPDGLTQDCLPGGSDGSADLGTIPVALAPLVTGALSSDAADGLFCPDQRTAGCFGSTACVHVEASGSPAGPLLDDGASAPITLAALFCIPATSSGIVNFSADLPGPGAATLTGTFTRHDLVGTTTTTVAATTTTTAPPSTTTTTTTPTTTTTTLLPPLLPMTVEFASTAGSGTCGSTADGSGATLHPLACGTLALGDGAGAIPASTLPDGAVVHFGLGTCGPPEPLGSCALTATTTAGPGFDCTTTGCFFGPPVPVPNAGLSACTVSTFAAPASGSVELLTGATTSSVALSLHLFLTGNPTAPCPRCSAAGSPGAPGQGTCDRGANAGGACTSTNSQGLSHDCLPGGTDGSVDLGTVGADLTPVTTGAVSKSAADGVLCPGQAHPGCFGDPACRSISATGMAPGVALGSSLAPQPATLVSTFCVPASGNALVDASVGLPGPAAITLAGTVRSQL